MLASSGEGKTVIIIVGVVLAVAAAAVLLFLVRWAMLRMILGPAEVQIEPRRVRLGEFLTVRYRQRVRKSIRLDGMTLALACREWVKYTRGTTTYRDTHEVLVVPVEVLGEQDLAMGERLEAELTLQVPAEGMHSFAFEHNHVEWMVRSEVAVKGQPDCKKEVPITVLPLLAPPADGAQGA